MSGPVRDETGPDETGPDGEAVPEAPRVVRGRRAEVGGLPIARVLPTKGRRTVGAWCFVDLMGPADGEDPDPMEVGAHPHTGLSTVTWLLEGEAVHRDSLGTEQPLRPGQLNLMTAGGGISHSELGTSGGRFAGVQLWVAQPEGTRHGASAFEHHGELPRVEAPGLRGTVLVGEVLDATSPARADTPMVGVDLTLEAGLSSLPLDASFEHALVPLDADVAVDGYVVERGSIALLPPGHDELPLDALDDARVLLLGGEPFGEQVQMWWNFVARSREEIEASWRAWAEHDERFGHVDGPLERIEAPVPPWVRVG